MAITTGAHPKALWPGVHAFVMSSYNDHPKEYTQIFDVTTSKMAYEEDVQTYGFGLVPVKTEGAALVYDDHSQGWTKRYTHVVYAKGYIVTMEEIDDNLYEVKAFDRGAKLARSFRITKEMVHANILNRAFDSGYTGGDGKELLATDHPSMAGTWSNELSPALDLSEAALEEILIDIMEAKDDKGLPIAIMPKKLIVPPALTFVATRLLESAQQAETGNNAINAIKGVISGGFVVNHYLTDSDAWFVKTDAPDGLRSFTRKAYSFGQDNDFDTKNAKAAGYERYSCGWTDPRALYGSAGA